jgi:hypothetical protein
VEIYLWLGKEVPQGLVDALFGQGGLPNPIPASGWDAAAAFDVAPPNEYATRIGAIIRTMRANSSSAQVRSPDR